MTLQDLGHGLEQIRAAVDAIEMKGAQNHALATYAIDQCNALIREINETAARMQHEEKEGEDQNG